MKKSLLIKNCQSYNSGPVKSGKKISFCRFLNVNSGFKFLLIMVGVSGLAYIFQINQLAIMGQQINEREVLLNKLKEENKALEIRITQLKSSYHFESERERLGLVSPDQVSFIEVGEEETVAMR